MNRVFLKTGNEEEHSLEIELEKRTRSVIPAKD